MCVLQFCDVNRNDLSGGFIMLIDTVDTVEQEKSCWNLKKKSIIEHLAKKYKPPNYTPTRKFHSKVSTNTTEDRQQMANEAFLNPPNGNEISTWAVSKKKFSIIKPTRS